MSPLGRIGVMNEIAFRSLINALMDESVQVRWGAARALRENAVKRFLRRLQTTSYGEQE